MEDVKDRKIWRLGKVKKSSIPHECPRYFLFPDFFLSNFLPAYFSAFCFAFCLAFCVLAFIFCLSCSAFYVLPFMFCQSVSAFMFCLSCSVFHVLPSLCPHPSVAMTSLVCVLYIVMRTCSKTSMVTKI